MQIVIILVGTICGIASSNKLRKNAYLHVIPQVFVFQLLHERLDKDNESEGHNIKGWNQIYIKGNTQKSKPE